MAESKAGGIRRVLERFAIWTTTWVGSSWAFGSALAMVVAWLVTGPIFGY